jgi:hypothetical protein
MHFHLPKPLHGWREFVGEVGIIVIGVLIALGAEQAAEALHNRAQVHEAVNKLHTESVENRSALDLDVRGLRQSQASIDTDLAVLGSCGGPRDAARLVPVERPVILVPTDQAWSGVRDRALLPLLPEELSDSYYKVDTVKDLFQSGLTDIHASRAEAAARVEAIRRGLYDQGSCRDAVVHLLRLKLAQEFSLKQAIAWREFNEQALRGERVDAVLKPAGLDLPKSALSRD